MAVCALSSKTCNRLTVFFSAVRACVVHFLLFVANTKYFLVRCVFSGFCLFFSVVFFLLRFDQVHELEAEMDGLNKPHSQFSQVSEGPCMHAIGDVYIGSWIFRSGRSTFVLVR